MTRFLLSVAAAVMLALGVAAPAQAQRLVVDDPTGDVYTYPSTEAGWVNVGSVVNTDLVRTTVDHRARDVRVRAKYVELTKGPSQGIQLGVDLQTGDYYSIFATAHRPFRTMRVTINNLDEDTGELDCPGARASLSFKRDTLTLVVPRACLGNPATVMFRGLAGSRTGEESFQDDALSADPFPVDYSKALCPG